jgi:hypothetical protein
MINNAIDNLSGSAALYRELRDGTSSVAEHERPYQPTSGDDHPSEHLLHLLWQRQDLLRQPLMALDHPSITVYRPGRWSRSRGPDFLDAKLRVNDQFIRVGAVEVHVWASDWFRHGHDLDPAYTKVLLHVVWHNDLSTATVVDASGREIPQLVLSGALTTPLAELQGLLDEDRMPTGHGAAMTPCQLSLLQMTPQMVGRLLEMAGEERWRQKANRFALRAERRGLEQALYETLMEALGYQGNRLPFWQLAKLAPVERLREALAAVQPTPIQVQAILFGVSGFLQRWQIEPPSPPQEGGNYIATLATHWEPVASLFPEGLDERQWRTAGIRPANFPQRRIAAAGYLLASVTQHSLMEVCFAPMRSLKAHASRPQLRRCLKGLARHLGVTGDDDFWSRRYAINGPEQRHPVNLLGPGRAATMVVDVVLPAAAVVAQLGREPIALDTVRALYLSHPRLPANEITRQMLRQFFGADHADTAPVSSACRQQGLMQLYRDFCVNELETCQECALPRLVARLEQLQRDAPRPGP